MKLPKNSAGNELCVERRKQVLKRTGLSHSHFYKLIELGLWIRPFKLNARAVGWFVHETDALITARTGGAYHRSNQGNHQNVRGGAEKSLQANDGRHGVAHKAPLIF